MYPSPTPTSRVSTKTRPARVCPLLFSYIYFFTSSEIKGVQEDQTCQSVSIIIIILDLFLHLLQNQGCPWKPDLPVCVLFTYIYFFTYSDIKGVQENQTCQGVSIIILVDLFLHLLRNQRCPENQISKKVFIRKLKIRSTPPPPTVH